MGCTARAVCGTERSGEGGGEGVLRAPCKMGNWDKYKGPNGLTPTNYRLTTSPTNTQESLISMSSSPSQKHAVVFGASGITGWRVVKELLSYPTATAFASVTGVTNRPLTVEGARLPPDPRLRLVSGVDLTASAESVVDVLRARIPDVGEITHAYLYGAFVVLR